MFKNINYYLRIITFNSNRADCFLRGVQLLPAQKLTFPTPPQFCH